MATFTACIKGARAIMDKHQGKAQKTCSTIDLQPFNAAMKLWVDDLYIRNNYLFAPGELHTVFWSLAALSNYIESSGIDQSWIDAGKTWHEFAKTKESDCSFRFKIAISDRPNATKFFEILNPT